jgi:tetratricopeptide (TPR) repeat protein
MGGRSWPIITVCHPAQEARTRCGEDNPQLYGELFCRYTLPAAHPLSMAPEPSNRRKHPRIRTKGMRVRWKSDGKTIASRLENVGLGGLYLHAANPAHEGTMIDVVLDLPTGQVYTRAKVRRSTPAKGMGLQFIQMTPEDRAKLHRYLAAPEVSEKLSTAAPAANLHPTKLSAAGSKLVISPRREEQGQLRFEREVKRLIELTGRGTYYQLLGVTSEYTASDIKKSFYSLARKFHPDNHARSGELVTRLENLMTLITEAYKTLANDARRAAYDKALAKMGGLSMRREKRETRESVEGWLERANQCLRAKNFAGSIVWLRKCAEAAPEHALYHAMLARSLATLPQYHNEAITHFQKAIDLDPWKEPVYLQFAELLQKMGLSSRALGVYSRLLDVCPGHAKAGERLATLKPARRTEKPAAWLAHLLSKKS